METSNSLISQSKNVFYIDSKERPTLTFFKGFTYTFNFASGQSEQFYISSSPTSDVNSQNELIESTTRSPSSNSVSFHVEPDCPNIIYYHSKLNPEMGGCIQVEELISNTILSNQTEPISNFTFRGDIQLQALFENEQYSVNIASTPGGKVIGIEKDLYEHGSIIELTAVPNEHYSFSKWNGLDESLAYNLTNTLLIENALDITALFELTDYNVSLSSNLNTNNSLTVSQPHHTTLVI